jgi:hypothetical protein
MVSVYIVFRALLNTPLVFRIIPKAHAFVQLEFKTSVDDIILAGIASYITTLVRSSGYLFITVAFLISVIPYINPNVFCPILFDALRGINRVTIELTTQATPHVNNPLVTQDVLRQVYGYLTTFIRSYDSLFDHISRVLRVLDRGSVYHQRLLDLEVDFWEAAQDLTTLYRSIERLLAIPIAESPLSLKN